MKQSTLLKEVGNMNAKKLHTYYDKYSNTVEYEYRGHIYEVEYSHCESYLVSPAWVQHKNAQEKIDQMLDKPKTRAEISEISGEPLKPFEEELNEIWKMLDW